MYKPDWAIVRKIKEYDPDLYFEWNSRGQFFELWRKMPQGPRLITPVTKSIYEDCKERIYAPVDERLLYWLIAADSWRNGGSKAHALQSDSRFKEFEKKQRMKMSQINRDVAKDVRRAAMNFYTRKPKRAKERTDIAPAPKRMVQSKTAPHIFYGSNK